MDNDIIKISTNTCIKAHDKVDILNLADIAIGIKFLVNRDAYVDEIVVVKYTSELKQWQKLTII